MNRAHILACLMVLLLLVWFFGFGRAATTSVDGSSKEAAPPGAAGAAFTSGTSERPDVKQASTSETLQAALSLDATTYLRLRTVLDWAAEDLNEEKGRSALVTHVSSDRVDMTVHALSLSDGELLEWLKPKVLTVLDSGKVSVLLEDPRLLSLVKRSLNMDLLRSDEFYSFNKLSDEGDVDAEGSSAYARFNVNMTMQGEYKGSFVHEGFTYVHAGKPGSISWTAMAKAPDGFFRKAKMSGVASRPKRPVYSEVYDMDNGVTELKDLTSPAPPIYVK